MASKLVRDVIRDTSAILILGFLELVVLELGTDIRQTHGHRDKQTDSDRQTLRCNGFLEEVLYNVLSAAKQANNSF